jgi:anti-anti-sigma regulatory factor
VSVAQDFEVRVGEQNGCIMVRIVGDLDGSSACEVLRVLEHNHTEAVPTVLDFSGLKTIHWFGAQVLTEGLKSYRLKEAGLFVLPGEKTAGLIESVYLSHPVFLNIWDPHSSRPS